MGRGHWCLTGGSHRWVLGLSLVGTTGSQGGEGGWRDGWFGGDHGRGREKGGVEHMGSHEDRGDAYFAVPTSGSIWEGERPLCGFGN